MKRDFADDVRVVLDAFLKANRFVREGDAVHRHRLEYLVYRSSDCLFAVYESHVDGEVNGKIVKADQSDSHPSSSGWYFIGELAPNPRLGGLSLDEKLAIAAAIPSSRRGQLEYLRDALTERFSIMLSSLQDR